MRVKLIRLSKEQIQQAKAKNGERKTITHAVLCGSYGQVFGNKVYCQKYFKLWSKIFPKLFEGGDVLDSFDIVNYESTFDLVNILIEKHDSIA